MIGFGSPNKAGTADTHGAPLGDDEISNLLNEKIDYKYQLARERKSQHSLEDIDNCIERIYKIEKLILENGFNTENAKRFIVSSKSLLQL